MNAPLFLDPAFLAVVTPIVKATLLLTAAALIDVVLRAARASACSRHLVWTAAIGALLVLPATSALPWHLDALTIPTPPSASAPASTAGSPMNAMLATTREAGMIGTVSIPSPRTPLPGPSVTPFFSSLSPREVLLALYMVGLVAFLLRLAAGRWSLRRIGARATRVTGEEWLSPLREIAWQLDVDRPVRLLRSTEVGIPMTWGTVAPIILLPAGAESWSDERRRVVLMHEMAHVVRCDFLTQFAAGIACAVYWFHPLVWYASRRLRVEREIACDDRVLSAGTGPGSYVTHLLEVAHACRRPRTSAAAAISMARPSQLEGRMLAAFDSARSRRVIGRTAVALAALGTLIVVSTVGSLRANSAQAAPAETVTTGATGATGATGNQPGQDGPTAPAIDQTTQGQLPDQTLKVRPGGMLTIDLRTGGAVRITGWDESSVNVRTILAGRDKRDTRVVLTPTGGSDVQLRSMQVGNNPSYSTSHRFEIKVPRSYNVSIKSNGGGIEISDVRGTFAGSTNGGSLHLSGVEGEARLSTNGGEITVSDARLDGYVSTNGGGVRFHNVAGNLKGSSNGGGVTRTSGSNDSPSSSPVNINSPGGPIDIDAAPYGASLHTGGGRIHLRSGSRFVNARTGGGQIILENIDGRVHATTGAGAVRVSLLDRTSGPHDVEIRSGSGSVELTLPADFDAELDIETGYTNSFGHRVSITSDFPLRLTESRDFESVNNGTPRKFVRGKASIGSGTHRVLVRTVNGNVIIRRRGAGRVSLGGPDLVTPAQPERSRGFAFVTGEGSERVGAIKALARSAPAKAAAFSLETLAFQESDQESMLAAVRELEYLGDPGLSGIIRVARTHSALSARRQATGSLGRYACDDAISALRRVAMSDQDAGLQQEAVRKLASTHSRTDVDRRITPAGIRDILREIARSHPLAQVRAEAERELGALSNG